MGRKKQIDTSMYFVPIPTAPITVKWGLATRLWVPAELISKPWVGSILDLGEPDPGGRRWRFGSGARSNGRSFHPASSQGPDREAPGR